MTTKGYRRKSSEEKLADLIVRIRDEDRIDRLFERCSHYLLEHTKELFLNRQLREANTKDQTADFESIKRYVVSVTSNWTIKNARRIPVSRLMAKILTMYKVVDPVEGDTAYTWHIVYNKLGYDDFPLDKDGLPPQLPGLPRSALVNSVRRAADKKTKGGERLGIIALSVREQRRHDKREMRILLVRKDNEGKSPVYDKKVAEMNRRHEAEILNMGDLKKAMEVPVEKSENIIDKIIDTWENYNGGS